MAENISNISREHRDGLPPVQIYVGSQLGSLDLPLQSVQLGDEPSDINDGLPSAYFKNEHDFNHQIPTTRQATHSLPAPGSIIISTLDANNRHSICIPSTPDIELPTSSPVEMSHLQRPENSNINLSNVSPTSQNNRLPSVDDHAEILSEGVVLNPTSLQVEREGVLGHHYLNHLATAIPRYVHEMISFMYITGQSTYTQQARENMTYWKWILSTIQKMMFWLFTFSAVFYCYKYIRYYAWAFVATRQMSYLVNANYLLVTLMIIIHATHLFAFCPEKLHEILAIWGNYETHANYICPYNQKDTLHTVITYGIVSNLISIIRAMFHMGFTNWSLEKMLLYFSAEFAEGFHHYNWNGNVTEFISLTSNRTLYYGTVLTPTTFAMGMLGLLGCVSYNLRIAVLRDLLIFVAMVNWHQVQGFISRIEQQLKLKADHTVHDTLEEDVKCWNQYRSLHKVIKITNSVFDKLLNFLHIYNFISFDFLLEKALDNNDNVAELFIFGIYNLGKTATLYLVARSSALKNGICEEWIEGLPPDTNRFLVGNHEPKRSTKLAELRRNPVGLGSVLINNAFLLNFLALLLSVFGILVSFHAYGDD